MNKAELVAAMAENAGLSKKDSEKALAAFRRDCVRCPHHRSACEADWASRQAGP